MFSQTSKPESEAPSGDTRRTKGASSVEPSVISADLKVIGNLHSNGELHIMGKVEGDIKSQSVTIGESAHVKGAISAERVHVSGSVTGQIHAPTVTVAKTAKMVGDIVHQTLSIEAGAHIEGQCRRLDSKKAEAPAPPPLKTAQPEPAAESVKKATVGVS